MIGDCDRCKSILTKVFFANPLQQPFHQTFLLPKFLLYGTLNWPTLQRCRTNLRAIMMYKIINNFSSSHNSSHHYQLPNSRVNTNLFSYFPFSIRIGTDLLNLQPARHLWVYLRTEYWKTILMKLTCIAIFNYTYGKYTQFLCIYILCMRFCTVINYNHNHKHLLQWNEWFTGGYETL